MDHVADARNYLVGSRTSDAYERMRGVLYRAVTLFLQGSYSRVKETGAELERHASATGLREYELFALFVRARTAFELGQYEQSAQELSRFLSVARLYGREVAFRTGMLWLARSSVYLGELSHAHDLMDRYGGTPESLLFRAEAYEFEGRLRDALECAHSGYETSYAPTDQNVERIRWSSGFSNIEDLVVRDEPVLSRLLWAYAAYLNARTGEVESGAASLQELTRQRTIVESDPYNRIYFYLYSEVLAAAATTRDDRATVLGKSVRFVQDRASRIDNYSDKTAFLHKNYWNSRIVNVARHHNLFT
jgi:tetratricopeptide (TPR) repeat protein